MKKRNAPRRGHYTFSLLLLSMLISALSFSQPIPGLLSGENNKPLAGASVHIKETRRTVITGKEVMPLSTLNVRAN